MSGKAMHDDDLPADTCAPFVPAGPGADEPRRNAALRSIATTMASIRRRIARREFVEAVLSTLPHGVDLAQVEVLGVIGRTHPADAARPGEDITVGSIAERLMIDPSRASRVVADVVDAGLARRVASQGDARRVGLELTDAGRDFADRFASAKLQVLRDALAGWSEADIATFATLFERFDCGTRDALRARIDRAEPPAG